ncbi:MAG: hypothetical protein FJX01_01975 [Alphaproteobacteria bacterium]|nr:hypothetical protein [Alphaproteobacteria bacterium]
MEKEMLVVVKFKNNMYNKFINFINSDDGLEERRRFATVEKSISGAASDKRYAFFKMFIHDQEALHSFFRGNKITRPIMDETIESYTVYNLEISKHFGFI